MDKAFIERTMNAHYLHEWSPDAVRSVYDFSRYDYDVYNIYTGEFVVKQWRHNPDTGEPEVVDDKTFLERRDIILVAYPVRTVEESLKRWLAVQKHDVAAVNSLYEWEKATNIALCELKDEISELEEMRTSPALQIHLDKLLERKEKEADELYHMSCRLSDLRDVVRKTPRKAQRTNAA